MGKKRWDEATVIAAIRALAAKNGCAKCTDDGRFMPLRGFILSRGAERARWREYRREVRKSLAGM